ncbi:unnamed protein product [Rotaria sordida]|uniref:Uncharacterized protein n=2 Tax=Rotaria sordida TaxID=392033 RepID=A0A818KJK9_9BILA|nr:unnamed protein product [Rotaria sordida]
MPTIDTKPRYRPFHRVLYREDSKDSTFTQNVSPQIDGHLITKLKKKCNCQIIGNNHKIKPVENIKYVKRIRNEFMAHYLFVMQQYITPNLSTLSHYENYILPDDEFQEKQEFTIA